MKIAATSINKSKAAVMLTAVAWALTVVFISVVGVVALVPVLALKLE